MDLAEFQLAEVVRDLVSGEALLLGPMSAGVEADCPVASILARLHFPAIRRL